MKQAVGENFIGGLLIFLCDSGKTAGGSGRRCRRGGGGR